ncbi:MAG: hypothetical protein JSW66_05050 [Phycisphaerales bacterium]|nr:MAG: hypothetical protein JSW66_05050 [Phycisphaerales bacterium]
MEESPKRLQLNTEQSTNLLKLGLDCGQNKTDQAASNARADLLADTLSSKMPVDPALLESLPVVLRSLSEQLQTLSGLPLGDVLLSPQTRIALIRRVKDFAKELGESAKDEVEREVALAVYYAAIASALVHHKVKISRHSSDKLEQSFEKLSTYDWVSPSLSRLFKKAHDYCVKKA